MSWGKDKPSTGHKPLDEFGKHTRQWFFNRIGKKIKRQEKNNFGNYSPESEFIITDARHANALYVYQTEFKMRYAEV